MRERFKLDADFMFATAAGRGLNANQVAAQGLGKPAEGAGFDSPELPPLTLHSLRHSAASHWLAEGVDLVTVAGRLGDTVAVLASRYAHQVDRVRAGGRQEPGSFAAAIEAGLGLAVDSTAVGGRWHGESVGAVVAGAATCISAG
jgi:integrase